MLASLRASAPAAADTYAITLDPALKAQAPRNGRVVLCFITEQSPVWDRIDPLEAPFFDAPQPIASVAVVNFKPGDSATIDDTTIARFGSLDKLHGTVRVQAVFDSDTTERSFLDGPGNVISDVVTATVSPDRNDSIHLTLTTVLGKRTLPPEQKNLKFVRMRSPMLSKFYGRDVYQSAGVALPNGYFDPTRADEKWPVVYVVPGFGGREDAAANYAEMLRDVDPQYVPQAVFVVLDPESPLGHHGFVDNENHGPRGTALVKELITYLEDEFRLDAREEARILYGHSSGGWTALWLQLNWPDTFGATWSSAPDPVDFSRFQMSNLYGDRNLYQYAPSMETPSYRAVDFDNRDVVLMTVRTENQMEFAIDPNGGSGQQWDAWEAMWSPRDPTTGMPRPMFDVRTGDIDRTVVNHWRQFDIRLKLVREWDTLGDVILHKVRLFCGEFDSYYLNRAVVELQDLVNARTDDNPPGPGYVKIVRFASHSSVVALTTQDMHDEMMAYLKSIEEE